MNIPKYHLDILAKIETYVSKPLTIDNFLKACNLLNFFKNNKDKNIFIILMCLEIEDNNYFYLNWILNTTTILANANDLGLVCTYYDDKYIPFPIENVLKKFIIIDCPSKYFSTACKLKSPNYIWWCIQNNLSPLATDYCSNKYVMVKYQLYDQIYDAYMINLTDLYDYLISISKINNLDVFYMFEQYDITFNIR